MDGQKDVSVKFDRLVSAATIGRGKSMALEKQEAWRGEQRSKGQTPIAQAQCASNSAGEQARSCAQALQSGSSNGLTQECNGLNKEMPTGTIPLVCKVFHKAEGLSMKYPP